MSDAKHIKQLLRERVEELAQYLFPSGKREGVHWCVGDITGAPGHSFKICIAGDKVGLWGDCADSQKHSRNLLDLWMQARNVNFKTALHEAAQWLGITLTTKSEPALILPRQSGNGEKESFDWESCVGALKPEHLVRLGNQRWYSRAFCSELREKMLIGLHKGCIAFPIHDCARNVVAVHYRLPDGSWRRYPHGKTAPLIIGELVAGEPVHVFESPWDGFAFMDESGERDGIIITRGSRNGKLVAGLIPAGATLYAWKQNDQLKNGKRAGDEWLKDVAAHAGTKVLWPKTPKKFKDLNDWTRAGATADDLLAAMMRAEEISRTGIVTSSAAYEARETETNWLTTIDAATVRSSELASLTLNKRRPLLGDWLCEGDYGIIFAPRGVGKTWLGLMIAKAVATRGHVGEWKAPAPARVLYMDGEMPPDLMRDRDKGLGSGEVEFLNHAILFDRTEKVLNITELAVQQAILQRCIRDNIRLLILDNLSTLASGIKENDSFEWEQLHNWLLQFRRHKIAVILIHHAGRSGEIRGTSKREDAAFWVIALDDAKKQADDKRGARFISRFTKPSRNTQDEVLSFEWHLVTDTATGEVSVGCKPAQTMDVFRQLVEAGVTECNQLAAEMRVSPATISRMAKKAIDEGWLEKKGREYVLISRDEVKRG
jgi:hypothetical protein